MPRKSKSVESAIDSAVIDEEQIPMAESAKQVVGITDTPEPTSEEWHDFVMGKFTEDELEQGKPTVDGLRRVTELLLGPIVRAIPHVVQAPNRDNGFHAVVAFEVSVAWGGDPREVRRVGDAADVYPGNTDPAFARFATAVATTRAEGRALRKALKLRKVVTAEEITTVSVLDSGLGGLIAPYQIRGVEKICRDLNINIQKLLTKSEFKYSKLSHMTSKSAEKMMEFLNTYLQNPEKIPDSIKPFNPEWRKDTGE